jgi:phosphatidylglycerophosphate synthase
MNKLLSAIGYKKYLQAFCLIIIVNTNQAPSFMIIIGFVLLVISFFYVIYTLLGLAKLYGLNIRRRKRLSSYITALFGSMIALQSIGQLSPRDVAALLPLAIIGYLYSGYIKTSGQKIN